MVNASLNRPALLVAAASIAAAGGLFINLLPLILGETAEVFELPMASVGELASSLLGGAFLTTIMALYWVTRVNWRIASLLSAIIGAIAVSLVPVSVGFGMLVCLWVVMGMAAAVPYCIALRFLAEFSNPARAFGVKLAFEIAVPALLFFTIPTLVVPLWGFSGALLTLAAIFVLLTLPIMQLPSGTRDLPATVEKISLFGMLPLWISLLTIAVYFGGATAMWAFLERIGNHAGLSHQHIGLSLGLAKVSGVLGAITAAIIGERLGQKWPHVISFLIMLMSLVLFAGNLGFAKYTFATSVFEYAWTFAATYQLALVANFKNMRHLVVLVPASLTLGGVFGPVLAGHLIEGSTFTSLFLMVGSISLFCLVVFLVLANQSERSAAVSLEAV